MNLLFTGASGFLGKNTLPILKQQFETVHTLGLTENDRFCVNLSREIPQLSQPYDVVLHAAGKAHVVPLTEAEKKEFYDINLTGTMNLCRALEKVGAPKALIFVSTVAVYGCDEGENISEEHPLDGDTPYADSKKKAERFLTQWCEEHHVVLSIVRPCLLAGPNPPGNLGSMIRGISTGHYLSINKGQARKSVLMVQDIARLVPLLAEKGGIYNVCDDEQPTFRQLEETISHQLGKRPPFNIPYPLAKCLALVGDCLGRKAPINSYKLRKITRSLTFSNEKAKRELGWKPLNVVENFRIN